MTLNFDTETLKIILCKYIKDVLIHIKKIIDQQEADTRWSKLYFLLFVLCTLGATMELPYSRKIWQRIKFEEYMVDDACIK